MRTLKKTINRLLPHIMIVIVMIVIMIISVPKAHATPLEEATELAKSIEAWLLLFAPVLASGIGVGFGMYRLVTQNVRKDRSEIKVVNESTVSSVKEMIRLVKDSTEAVNSLQQKLNSLNTEIVEIKQSYNDILLERKKLNEFIEQANEIIKSDIVV